MSDRKILTLDDLSHLPLPAWMVEGMFEKDSLVMVVGPPGSYKSFLAIDWSCCIASGMKWNNRNTMEGNVLYCPGEGKSNMFKRIQVWEHYFKPSKEQAQKLRSRFRVTFEVPQLAHKSSVDNLLADLQVANFKPDLIIIDTFARSFVGLDENSQKDTGLWVEQADRLRQLGFTVVFLHHTAKNIEFGVKYRGSSAIMGAMDTAVTFVKDGKDSNRVRLEISKQKDHDEGKPMYFVRQVVRPLGYGDEGSIVLTPTIVIDDRFQGDDNFTKPADPIQEAIDNPSFLTDQDRARHLSEVLGISEDAARKRIAYKRKVKLA